MILQFLRHQIAPGIASLEIKGNVHCGPECARMEKEVDALIQDKLTNVVFDLKGVTHMDSAAIGSVVRCNSKLKSVGGGLRLASAQPMIEHSLKITKVDKIILVYPGVSEAAASFGSAGSATPA
jgi:anti-anti-sigma factor